MITMYSTYYEKKKQSILVYFFYMFYIMKTGTSSGFGYIGPRN